MRVEAVEVRSVPDGEMRSAAAVAGAVGAAAAGVAVSEGGVGSGGSRHSASQTIAATTTICLQTIMQAWAVATASPHSATARVESLASLAVVVPEWYGICPLPRVRRMDLNCWVARELLTWLLVPKHNAWFVVLARVVVLALCKGRNS